MQAVVHAADLQDRDGGVLLPGVEGVPVMGVEALGSGETAGGAWQPARAAATIPRLDASRTGRGNETNAAKEGRVVMVLGSGSTAMDGAKHRTPGLPRDCMFCNVLLSMAASVVFDAIRWAKQGMAHGAG